MRPDEEDNNNVSAPTLGNPQKGKVSELPSCGQEYYHALIQESPTRPGDHGIPPKEMNLDEAPWFQPDLIPIGKDFVRRNFYSVMLAHCISLMWVFTFKPGRAVLLGTGGSSCQNSRNRYLSTVLHIKLWYESDFLPLPNPQGKGMDISQKGSQDIYSVRKQHGAAARNYSSQKCPNKSKEESQKIPPSTPKLSPEKQKLLQALQADLRRIEESSDSLQDPISGPNPQVPMSQFSMVVTQFCFVGFILLFPGSFGIRDTGGMEGFLHLWAVYGRFLGIEDRYNLGVHFQNGPGSFREGTKDLEGFHLIFRNLFLPSLKNTDETAMEMWQELVKGFSQYMTGLRLKPLIQFMVQHGAGVGAAGNLEGLMNWRDKFAGGFLHFSTFHESELWRKFRNRGVRFSIFMAQRRFLPRWKRGKRTKAVEKQ